MTRERIDAFREGADLHGVLLPIRKAVAETIKETPRVRWEVCPRDDHTSTSYGGDRENEVVHWLKSMQARGFMPDREVVRFDHYPAYEKDAEADYRVLQWVRAEFMREDDPGRPCDMHFARYATHLQDLHDRFDADAFAERRSNGYRPMYGAAYRVGDYARALLLTACNHPPLNSERDIWAPARRKRWSGQGEAKEAGDVG